MKGKVLITSKKSYGKGGVANYFRVLEPYLSGNVDHFVFQKREGGDLCGGLWKRLQDYRRFRRAIRDYELVHLNPSLGGRALIRDGLLLRAAQKQGNRAVVFFRGWDKSFEKTLRDRWLWLFKRVFFRADAMIVLGTEFKKALREMGYEGPIFVETTLVDDAVFAEDVDQEYRGNEQVHVLFLSRLVKEKGVYEAIDAVALLQEKGMNLTLTVAGDGRELVPAKEYVSENGIDGICFPGYVRGAEKMKLFKSADLYLFPSFYGEGMPNCVLEAMASGLPVVTRPVGGLKDFFVNGEMGYATESKDPEVFAELLEKLVRDPALRNRMGRYNREYAETRFRASVVAERLQDIYRTVLGTANGSGKVRR